VRALYRLATKTLWGLFVFPVFLAASESSDQCGSYVRELGINSPVWISSHQEYLILKDSFEEMARYLRNSKGASLPVDSLDRTLKALRSLKEESVVYQKSATQLEKILNRVAQSTGNQSKQKADSQLMEALGVLGEILVSMGLWGLERVQALSGDLYPEKLWLDRKELRSIYRRLVGETDVIFRARTPEEFLAEPDVIRVAEVKTLLKGRALTKDEFRQAQGYAEMAEAKKRLGYKYRVYYFFPLEAPSPHSNKRLEAMGITVIRGQ